MNINMSTLKIYAKENNIVMILLFGSRATDRFREDSDIDLGILFKGGDYNYEEVLSGLIKLFPCSKIDVAILNHSDPLLNFQILSKHEIIYCPDKEVFLRFFADTVKKYHDMQKIYRLTDKYLKDFTGGKYYGTVSCHPPKVN
ncbi:MAG: nucleotidyltransferase domain-containing protein [Bacillota bacterium]|nr:nucleotidyltransferase domain-containing protein [Bacillota bacterium]